MTFILDHITNPNPHRFWAPIEISESDDQQDDQQATDNKDVNDPV